VQTPNFWFPIEPHYLMPGMQYLPFFLRWRATFICPAVVFSKDRPPTRQEAISHAAEIDMLSASQMRSLFPNSRLYRERFCGTTKSLIVYRTTDTDSGIGPGAVPGTGRGSKGEQRG
jgi:hypothetical protein